MLSETRAYHEHGVRCRGVGEHDPHQDRQRDTKNKNQDRFAHRTKKIKKLLNEMGQLSAIHFLQNAS